VQAENAHIFLERLSGDDPASHRNFQESVIVVSVLFSELFELVLVEANGCVCGSIVDIALTYVLSEAAGKAAHRTPYSEIIINLELLSEKSVKSIALATIELAK
jgi:hypothetical protein